MSGPVLSSASGGSVWGSATGALFSWEPFDFGLRQATVPSAEAAVARARAGEALTRLDVQTAVGTAFLGIVGAQRAVAALQADVDRRDLLSRAVHTLVDNQLRPGAEASRSDAERAAAQTRLIQAQQAVTLAQISLARVLGVTTGPVAIDATTLAGSTAGRRRERRRRRPTHPLAQVRQAAIDVARAQEEVLSRTDLPRVYVQSSVFARGSGANAERPARRRRLGPRSRPRQLGGRRPGGVSQRVRLHQPPRPQGRRRGVSACRDRAVRRGAPDRHEPAAGRRGHGAGGPGDRRQHARATRGGAAERIAGARPLPGGPRQHRRSGGRAEPARAGRSAGPARADRRVARPAGAGRCARHADAVSVAA